MTKAMNFLSSIITYVRRLVKAPSNQVITDDLIVDYINRFFTQDMSLRMQLFDFKTKYQFLTIPGVDQYNMPLYGVQTESPSGEPTDTNYTISYYPVYQGFMSPARINGINAPFYTSRSDYFDLWPTYLQQLPQAATGDGTTGPYTITLPYAPALPGHLDISGVIYGNYSNSNISDPIYGNNYTSVPNSSIWPGVYFSATGADGKNITIQDSGQFLSNVTDGDLYGLLIQPGGYPNGNSALPNGGALPTPYSMTQNTINYNTGVATNVYFPTAIPDGTPISASCYFIEQGLPRAVLFYNNVITLRNPPNTQYLVELDAYLTPAAYLQSSNDAPIQFGYMSEYIARGAARKLLADTGDWEQFNAYEPLFKEQELLVWKRSQRQVTSTRTNTIYSNLGFQGNYNQSSLGT